MRADANPLDVFPSLPDGPLAEELATVRKALEQAQRREHELDDTFENGAMPLHWVGPDGTILRANRAELDLLGYGRDEYVGHNIAEFYADESVITELLRRLHADEVVRNYAARMRCRDGSIKHVLIDSSVYRHDDEFIHTRCFTRDVTSSVLATEALRYSEERFHRAAEATRDLIWDWDLVDGAVSWAGAVREYLSPLPGDATSGRRLDHRAWASRVHPDDLPPTEAVARTAFESGAGSWEHEYRFLRADGTYACMTEHASIVRDAAGRPIRVVGAMRDDTQRKASEEATLRLAAIVTSATDAIVGKTTQGIVTSWNAAAERMFGYSEQEMVGQSIFRLIPEELHEEERTLLARVQRGERVEYSTTERVRKDGSRLVIALSVSPIWDASGRVVGVSSIKRDVTERQRAELELARREERYRALVMATTSVVWTTDSQGRFVEPQPGWEAYTGQPWGEHRESGWLLALHPDDRDEFRRAWLGAEQRRAFFEAAGRIWHHAGHRYRRFIARAAPVPDPDGGIREWIGTLTDVEEQRQAEERLRQADRLESVARLAGGVAHEANNQMTVVLGAAAFLLRHIRDHTAVQDLEQIRDAAQRTAAITQQLLAFSRRQMLQPQLVDLNAVVSKLEPVLQRALGETSRVVVRLAPDLGAVKADPRQLEQVLLNLTFNARDAMQGGGILTVETASVLLERPYVAGEGLPAMPPGQYARIVVGDTGHGMDRATLGRIFEPFFTTKPVGAGTGLGLSTVYGIVKQSGGFVWVYSEPGRGTTFKIYLPVVAATSGQPLAPSAEPPQGAQEVILVVEDDEAVRGVLARSLREYGYTVVEARDGVEALDVISKQTVAPRLVVADVVMPRFGGPELSAELLKHWPDLPVLFISGYTDLDSVSRGLVEDGREFLQKPIEPQALARKVRAMLQMAGKAEKAGGE